MLIDYLKSARSEKVAIKKHKQNPFNPVERCKNETTNTQTN